MNIVISPTAAELGKQAAGRVAEKLKAVLAAKATARMAVSTGASQLDTIDALVQADIDWPRVELFHLDEYAGLPDTHPASFRKYLRERLTEKVPVGAVHWVEDTPACIPALTREIRRAPIDIGLIGIGENAHIAFNDPPADFETDEAYIVVNLDDACKRQQAGEGWFASPREVPAQAISMTVRQIMRCESIISCVPYAVKANAIADMLAQPGANPMVPASILKTHPDFHLYLEESSWNGFDEGKIVMPDGRACTVQHV